MAVTKETIFRWPLNDLPDRFEKAKFKDCWASFGFQVKCVPKAIRCLLFCPKGDREEYKAGCPMYLHVQDFGDHPFIRLKYELWLESGDHSKAHFKQQSSGSKFIPTSPNWGWSQMCTQKELLDLAKRNSLVVVCKTVPLDLIADTEESAPLDVLDKLAADFDSMKFADVEVRVQGKVFNVNKMIICSGSPVFHRMFTHATKEKKSGAIEVEKEDADMIELLLRYLYSGKVVGLKDVAARLLPVADCYEVLHLSAMCLESLYNHVSVETVLRDLKLAYAHDHAGYFKEKLLQFAQKNFKLVRQQADWTPEFVEGNSQIVMDVVASLTP